MTKPTSRWFTLFVVALSGCLGASGATTSASSSSSADNGGAGGAGATGGMGSGAGQTASSSAASGGGGSLTTATSGGGGAASSTGSTSSGGGGGSIATAGCGIAQTAGVKSKAIDVAGEQRTFVLVVPESYDKAAPIPLIFGWHGLSWQGASFRPTIDVETELGEPAVYVYPDGLEVAGLPPEAAGGVSGLGWDWRVDGRDVAFFDALHAELTATHCIDPERVWSYGRSHGGFFAHALACARAGVVRRSATVSGGLPSGVVGAGCEAPHMPIWIAHNSGDPVVPVSLGRAARDQWVARDGCGAATSPAPPSPCVAYDGCAHDAVVYCETSFNYHAPPPFAAEGIAAFFLATP